MSTAEIIEQIKKLTPEERREVEVFLTDFQTARDAQSAGDSEDSSAANDVSVEFKSIAGKVFDSNNDLFRKLAE